MRRYDTFTPKAKTAFERTLKYAQHFGKTLFICNESDFHLNCKQCPMYKLVNGFTAPCAYNPKTAEEWLAWANEEVGNETN